ncbi:MAG: phosphotransferase [Myxococcales bacterium]|nr:phosphotransferase [Myxococcales bacterium]MCB9648964.1 phosphotransferase [Deltaproteobacteria bacterium]
MRAEAEAALAAYHLPAPALRPVEVGLINVTFEVTTQDGLRYALQRVNPIFGPGVHEDIHAVTTHLARKGLVTPRLVPTRSGDLYTRVGEAVWRLMTWVEGENLSKADSPARARAAGVMLGRFHAAVQDLSHAFVNTRLGVHDTPAHLAGLAAALEQHPGHPLYPEVAPLTQGILQTAAALGPLPLETSRVVHGDPKLNNLIFDPATGEAICLIDLDTLAEMPIVLELGDAFRSWCNPGGEDTLPGRFDLALFEGAVAGYATGAPGLLSPDEVAGLVTATATIMLELAARFARDALEERYFGWDATRYPTRGAHNLLRARVQRSLADALLAQRDAAEAVVRRALGRG